MYIPPSEFDPREWDADHTHSPSPMPTTTQTPGFEFLFAMIGVVAAMCLVGRRRIATSDEEITCLKIADKNRKMYMG